MKLKKLYKFLLLILCFIVFIILITVKKDYSIKYKIDGFDIEEKYYKELNMYYFSVKYKEDKYELALSSNSKLKKLISEVKTYNLEDETVCLYLKSKKLDTYPVCKNKTEYMSLNMVDTSENLYNYKKVSYNSQSIDNINFYTTLNKKFYLWNYKGYIEITNNKINKKDFLDNESYYNSLSIQNGKYLIIPDYDSTFSFNKYYIINMENGKIKEWNINFDISFNSYYLGSYNKNIYLVDKKNKLEYSINPSGKKIEIIGTESKGGTYFDKKWIDVSMTKLINNTYEINNAKIYNYEIDNGKLYQVYYKGSNKNLISENAETIISVNNEEVFYLNTNTLYYYSPFYGVIKVADYKEWNFNNTNQIFIY